MNYFDPFLNLLLSVSIFFATVDCRTVFMYIDQQYAEWWMHKGTEYTWSHGNCLQKCPQKCRESDEIIFHYVAASNRIKKGWYCSAYDWQVWVVLDSMMWGAVLTLIPVIIVVLFFCCMIEKSPLNVLMERRAKQQKQKKKEERRKQEEMVLGSPF